jgi:hypothetical protein
MVGRKGKEAVHGLCRPQAQTSLDSSSSKSVAATDGRPNAGRTREKIRPFRVVALPLINNATETTFIVDAALVGLDNVGLGSLAVMLRKTSRAY